MRARAALFAQADALAAQSAALRALAEAMPDAEADDLLTLAEIAEHYSHGPDAVRAAIARGDLSATRGPRQRIQVRRSEFERWRESRPVQIRQRRRADVIDLDAWEAQTDRELRAIGGGR